MASSTALSLSWSSSLCSIHSFTGVANETLKVSERRSTLDVVAQKKAQKLRKVILKEDVTDLGKQGQLLDVKAGFFRNFLLPTGKAQLMTPLLLKEMKMEDERIEAEKQRVKEEAQQLAMIFETVGTFKVKRKGGKGKQIFGSVTAQDLVDIIKAQLQSFKKPIANQCDTVMAMRHAPWSSKACALCMTRDIEKRLVSLPEIRETGEYIAELKLHPDVTARVRLNVFAN